MNFIPVYYYYFQVPRRQVERPSILNVHLILFPSKKASAYFTTRDNIVSRAEEDRESKIGIRIPLLQVFYRYIHI